MIFLSFRRDRPFHPFAASYSQEPFVLDYHSLHLTRQDQFRGTVFGRQDGIAAGAGQSSRRALRAELQRDGVLGVSDAVSACSICSTMGCF